VSDWRQILENAQAAPIDTAAVQAVISQVAPGRTVSGVSRMRGGLGAVLHLIGLHPQPDQPDAMVLRQLMPEWGETAQHLEREATTVDRLDRSSDVPVPSVFWSDPDGGVFGRPAMLMEFVAGQPLVADLESPDASAALATALAHIHDSPVAMDHLRSFDSVAAHPEILGINPGPSEVIDAEQLRRALEASIPGGTIVPSLVHGDFHGGNVLWNESAVTAVLDWPMATRASRWWDEAYAHMDTWLAHGERSAARFRSLYRELAGHTPDPPLQRFWDLTALIRALPSPGQWLESYRHAGVTTLDRETLDARFADMAERVL
jgi:aminoglycoside phosphotransferase (APT) family kinase protein